MLKSTCSALSASDATPPLATGLVFWLEQPAMAMMARSLQIPARVAVGFLKPEKVGDSYVYSAHDLHAWPELYFTGVGWVPFEPTPGRGSIPDYAQPDYPQRGYQAADLSVVYPVARGTGPLLSASGAFLFLGEQATALRIAGMLLTVSGILVIARIDRSCESGSPGSIQRLPP